MSRMSISTPCPPPTFTSSRPPRRSSIFSTSGGDNDTFTGNVDVTNATQKPSSQNLTSLQPRRRSAFHRRPERQAPVHIFEDVAEDEELVVEPQPKNLAGNTLLGKPAQKMPVRRTSSVLPSQEDEDRLGKQVKKRESILPNALFYESTADEHVPRHSTKPTDDFTNGNLKKNPRRRTIFVPDDTTVMSIHPGGENTARIDDTFQLHPLPPQLSSRPVNTQQLKSRPASRKSLAPAAGRQASPELSQEPVYRRPRMSLAALPPKRVPLGQVRNKTSNRPGCDVNGQNGGKENTAPRSAHASLDKPKPYQATTVIGQQAARSRLDKPTAASMARQTIVPRPSVPILRSQKARVEPITASLSNRPLSRCDRASTVLSNSGVSKINKSEARAVRFARNSTDEARSSPISSSDENKAHKRTSPFGTSSRSSRLSQYPVLAEHVAQPQLYEDNWLNHQEIALSELINGIFLKSQPDRFVSLRSSKSLRERMLDIYHQPKVTTLHKRLQASLLYGAFCHPRETATNAGPAYDLGLRKRFLGLWLDNYTEEALRTAAEVVVGRQLLSPADSGSRHNLGVAEDLMDPLKSRRALAGFLETFLVSVDDVAEGDEAVTGSTADLRWRKMMLRSLMLVWLLDQSKSQGAIQSCLFQAQSTKKSTAIILLSLGTMLIPSVGDILRVLRNFDYEATHEQDPLDEVNYSIENMAVDLRDGILLTRLVELLVFPKLCRQHESPSDATVTIQLPDARVLESDMSLETGAIHPRTLSQHLKMPCLGRAQKLYNVQIALSALGTYGGPASNVVQDITAEDIVDGHRERSLSLLWSLVSSHVLPMLVDWQQLKADVVRNGHPSPVDSTAALNRREREELLKAWANSYSAPRGVKVRNLTTSFADGSVYTCILDSFTGLIENDAHDRTAPAQGRAIADRLRSLGCSTAFIKQLTASQGQIQTETTTVSNLAFLASRLLPLASNHHAAVLIQRAWRKRNARVILRQRIVLMRLAHGCATVVQTQQTLIHSATVIQQAWRQLVSRRRTKLNGMVAIFQDQARGWLVRRNLRLTTTNRVMSGW